MRRASIVSIGNEILSGRTIDTNASYLSGRLFSAGIPVVSVYVIGDEIEAIVRALNLAGGDADVVLATGGLGPTDDDVTREALAKFLGAELQFRQELFEQIESFFERRGIRMSEKNRVQAYLPAGSAALGNKIGTAPGVKVEWEGKLFFCLPGVPSEMKQMFEESVFGRLKELAGEQALVVRKLQCFGAGESGIAEMLGPLMGRGRNPLINSTARHGVITLHIIAAAEDHTDAQQMAESDEGLLRERLGELVYGRGEETLSEVVGRKLRQGGKTIAVAESCTGGALSKLLTDVPGASGYFVCGWVTYDNAAKTDELGVAAELIEKYGAVSEEVALAMAEGARGRAGTDFAIGITGIAGPEGGSEQKPVGLVYISVCGGEGSATRRFVLSGDRNMVRLRAAQTALNMLRLSSKI